MTTNIMQEYKVIQQFIIEYNHRENRFVCYFMW